MSAAEIIGAIALVAIALGIGIAIGRALASSTRETGPQPATEASQPTTDAPHPDPTTQVDTPATMDSGVLALLKALPGIVIVVDAGSAVVFASDQATREHLVRRKSLTNDEIAAAAAASLGRNETIVHDVTVLRPPLRRGRLDLRVNAIPIGVNPSPDGVIANRDEGQISVLLLEDLTVENRLRVARRDFIANVSHELKTPVGAMSLLAEALVAASDDKESVEHFAWRLQTEAKRLTSLINDVIDLSRMQGDDPMPNPRPVDIQALVEKSVGSVASAGAAKNIDMVISSREHNTVVGDSDQLLIALTNLLTNAIAYSEPGTHIAIVVREDDGFVEVDVKDQGIGIPEDELGHIFERFYRVDEARSRFTGGTGLGLAIVRNVCRNHGGDVAVWSVEGEGSTFTIKLPTADSEAVVSLTGDDPQVTEAGTPSVAADPNSREVDPSIATSDQGKKLDQHAERVETQPIQKIETADWSTMSEERR